MISRVLLDSLPAQLLAVFVVFGDISVLRWRVQVASTEQEIPTRALSNKKNVEFTERGKKTPSQVAPVLCIRIRGEVRVDRKTSDVAMKVVKSHERHLEQHEILTHCQKMSEQHRPTFAFDQTTLLRDAATS